MAITLVFVSCLAMAQTPTESLKKSDIVIVGTVVQTKAVSFAGVPVSANTLIVAVDGVISAPPVISLVKGDRVTIAVKDPAKFKKGTRATFYATGWILGTGIALREVSHEIESGQVGTATISGKRESLAQARKDVADTDLQRKISAAQTVVAGRVIAVRPDTMSAFVAVPKRITEHDPNWQEAVIKVEDAIKGATVSQELVIRFPASIDVQWYSAPKFSVGQEGTFILNRDQVSGTSLAMHAGSQVQAYTALTSQQVLPREESARVRRLANP